MDIVLESLEALENAFENHILAPLHAGLVGFLDLAFGNEGTGDDGLVDLENLAHFRLTLDRFLLSGVQQANHGGFDFFGDLVDDIVEADINAFFVSQFFSLLFGLGIKGDDDGF